MRLSITQLGMLILGLVGGTIVLGGIHVPTAYSQAVAASLEGYAWSDTVGWISFDCADPGTCATRAYGVDVSPSGVLSGYGWSEHVGWVSANSSDLAGCPSAPCEARIGTGALTGWMRALAGGTSQSGAWDGWIRLNGTTYGPTLADGIFTGYGWGSDVVGWVDFRYARSDYQQCTPTYYCSGDDVFYRTDQCVESFVRTCEWGCSNGACLLPQPASVDIRVAPTLIASPRTVQVIWEAEHATSCSVTGTNGDAWSGTSGTRTSSIISAATTFTLSCIGEDDDVVTDTATVRLSPNWREF